MTPTALMGLMLIVTTIGLTLLLGWILHRTVGL